MGVGGDEQKQANQESEGGLGGIGDKLNAAGVGGRLGGNTAGMDLRVQDSSCRVTLKSRVIAVPDAITDHGLGQSQKTMEHAVDQADNEQISEFLRSQCKSNAGKDLQAAQRDAAEADREARET
ncbi:MAG: hypothetical protein LQ347_004529 [Umbilicaria vellea]|nr:MAG: hypothetical protein LQ347_004529 [Umbilicaria vellea]